MQGPNQQIHYDMNRPLTQQQKDIYLPRDTNISGLSEHLIPDSQGNYQYYRKKDMPFFFRVLLKTYQILQYLLVIFSLVYIFSARVLITYYENDFKYKWQWSQTCTKRFYMYTGIQYALANSGFVNFFMTKYVIKYLDVPGFNQNTIPKYIKNFVEILMSLSFLAIQIQVFVVGIFDKCGAEEQTQEIKRIFMVGTAFFIPFMLSFIIFVIMKRVYLKCDKIKTIYKMFYKPK